MSKYTTFNSHCSCSCLGLGAGASAIAGGAMVTRSMCTTPFCRSGENYIAHQISERSDDYILMCDLKKHEKQEVVVVTGHMASRQKA